MLIKYRVRNTWISAIKPLSLSFIITHQITILLAKHEFFLDLISFGVVLVLLWQKRIFEILSMTVKTRYFLLPLQRDKL
jgi:hypothetical protein